MKNLSKNLKIIIPIIILCVIGLIYFFTIKKTNPEQENVIAETPQVESIEDSINDLDQDQILAYSDDLLRTLFGLYLDSQEKEQTDLDTMDFLIELRNTINSSQRNLKNIEKYIDGENFYLSQLSKLIYTEAKTIENSYSASLEYMESLIDGTGDVSQVEIIGAKAQSDRHNAYLNILALSDPISLLYITGVNEEAQEYIFTINEDSRAFIVGRIDDLFSEAFIEWDERYEQTGDRNAILEVVKSIRKILE